MAKYRVYVFLDPKNRPYYVGKTNNFKRRKKEHLKEVEKGNTLPKYNKVRKLIKNGHSFKMRTIVTTENENKAYRLERYYIKKLRKDGYQLLNCTFGGPDELPMRINKPKKVKKAGIKLPFKAKKKKIRVKKKLCRKNKKMPGVKCL